MASFKIFCEPIVEFNPYIHTNVGGFDAGSTLYNRGRRADITLYTGIYDSGNSQFIWRGIIWDFKNKGSQKAIEILESMYGQNENTQVFVCYPSCEESISQEIPEPDFIVSLGMVIVALLWLGRYRNSLEKDHD